MIISDSVLSHIETGKTESPSPEYLKKLATEYCISVVDLFLKAGYLEYNDLTDYQRCFSGVNHLSEGELRAVQNIIDVIANKPAWCP